MPPRASDLTARLTLPDLRAWAAGLRAGSAAIFCSAAPRRRPSFGWDGSARGLRVGQPQADRLLAGDSTLRARLRLADGAIRVDDVQLSSPQITAAAKGRLTEQRREVDITARLANLGLLLPEFPGPVTIQGRATEEGNGYVLALTGTGPGQIDARGRGAHRAEFRARRPVHSGHRSGGAGQSLPRLPRAVAGRSAPTCALSGLLRCRPCPATVALTGGRLADPGIPFSLERLDATARLSGGQAQVQADNRHLHRRRHRQRPGGIGLAAPYAADLAVSVNSVVLRDPQLYQTRANGDLRVTGPLTGGALISGRIALPETELFILHRLFRRFHAGRPAPHLRTRSGAGNAAPRGLLGEAGGTAAGGPVRPFGLNVTVSAPNRLFIRGAA